jgi:ABC-type transporter Mla subunit MlaD
MRRTATTLKISRDADSLIAEHQAAVVRKLEVLAPARDELSKDPLQAVGQITTGLPRNLRSFLTPESLMTLNQAAVFGALTLDNGRCFIGSRLSVVEQEQAWNLYIPFLLCAVISGKEYHADAILSMLGKREAKAGDSAWTVDDSN